MKFILLIPCWLCTCTVNAFTFHSTFSNHPSLYPYSKLHHHHPHHDHSTTTTLSIHSYSYNIPSTHLYMTQESQDDINNKENENTIGDDDDDNNDDEEEEEVEPGMLKISEIKAELKLRGVNYADCFDRESLEIKLRTARATGKADPSILQDFNSVIKPEDSKDTNVQFQDEDINAALGNDGKLPGGMSPEMVQTLMSNPELMTLLQDPKMQECMKIIMTEGQEKLEEKMKVDEDLRNKVIQLNRIMGMSM